MKTSFLILINKMITGVCKLFGYNASPEFDSFEFKILTKY